jgi:thiamine pyrophosphate-dependent acetolactate synthase large subunit-like protein
MNEANPINPQRVFWELSPRLPERCILSCDSGSAANWYARDVKIRRGMMASLSGNLANHGLRRPVRRRRQVRLSRTGSSSRWSATERCR